MLTNLGPVTGFEYFAGKDDPNSCTGRELEELGHDQKIEP